MASSSRKCSDEELQKALADLDELIARNPIPDEFKYLCPEEEDYSSRKEERKEKEKKKKKKLYKLPPDQVRMLLSYKCAPLPERQGLAKLEEEDKEKYKDMRTTATVSDTFHRYWDDFISTGQEKVRHELLTKGYVTYEATDDEEEEETPTVPHEARGGGWRRHRRGVTKSAGGAVKKLN
ncbi:unnamed protein product [Urochloa humidicola]